MTILMCISSARPIDAFENTWVKVLWTAELIRKGKLFKQCILLLEKAGKGQKQATLRPFIIKYQDSFYYKVCRTAATNMFDDYKGEEILFMDDVRGGCECWGLA